MAEPMEIDVVSQLEQLAYAKKNNLAETFKDFNLFVKSRDAELSRVLPDILDSYNPSSNVGKLFKVKLIDKYKLSSFVVKALQSDDSLYVGQIMKCKWFFEEVDDPESFVTTVVPKLSLNARLKVVNKFAAHLKTAKTGDVLYAAMKKRYGVKSALPLLSVCTENFIRNELPNVKTPLPPNVTLALYKKYPSLATEYVKYLADSKTRKRKPSMINYQNTFTQISQKDMKSFLNLFEHNNDGVVPYLKLGRRPTKNLLKTNLNEILNNYNKYSRILVDKTFFSRLSLDQYRKLYMSLFPDKMSEFCSGMSTKIGRSLSYVKPENRSSLILSTFKQKYNVDMTSDDVLSKLDETWVDSLPKDAKNKWLEMRIAQTSDLSEQARYTAELPVDLSVPRLKKILESQSDADVRSAVVGQLIRTITYNQASSIIKDSFAYVVKRFRNEVTNFRRSVVNEMAKFKELLLKINVEDWIPINDFINIIKLNGEVSLFLTDLLSVFRYQVASAFAGVGDVDVVIKSYLEYEKCDSADLTVNIVNLCQSLPCEGSYLKWLGVEVEGFTWNSREMKVDFALKLFSTMCSYCKKREVIDVADWILDVVEEELNCEDISSWKKKRILAAVKNHPLPRLLKYVATFPEITDVDTVCNVLKKEPSSIIAHVDKIVTSALRSPYDEYVRFYKKCRMYDGLGVAGEIAQRCYKVTTEDPDDLGSMVQPNAVRVMALLLDPAEFVKIASHYLPEGKTIEEFSSEIKARYDVQTALCKSFIDVSSSLTILPTIRDFATGDYLKLVAGSLVATCLKIPENQIMPILQEWINCPVSLRKHLLRLTNDVAPADYRIETFINIFKTEKNVSLRLVLFKMLRSEFVETPSEDTFMTFKSIVGQLTVDDEEALKLLIDVDGIEDDFVSPYLQLLWQLVDTDWGSVLKDGKSQIINLVDENVIKILNDGFCDTLVTHELTTKLPHAVPSNILQLYLLWAPSRDVQTARFCKVVEILRPLCNLWDVASYTGGPVFQVRRIVRSIVNLLCSESQTESFFVNPSQLLVDFKQFLTSTIKPQHLLRETLSIDLALLHPRRSSSTYTKEVAQLYSSYVETFGQNFTNVVASAIAEQVPASLNMLALVTELLSKSDSGHDLVAIELLKTSYDEDEIPNYKPIFVHLAKSEHPSVQIAVNEFFHSITVE